MRITRHPVDLERVTTILRRRQERLTESLEKARGNPRAVDFLYLDVAGIYFAGSVVAPDAPEVARALRLGAQAGTAIFLFQQIEDPPRPFVLGEGPPVVYTKPVPAGSADDGTWMRTFDLCLIAREAGLLDELCRVPNEVFRHSDIVGAADADYGFADLLRAVWTQERFTADPVFAREEAECRVNAQGAPYVRRVTLPYLEALRCLEQHDEAGFAAALTEGLEGYKAWWSSKKRREEFGGFVSLQLTAAAALAWDRGLRFEAESDYLPMSWVRGDHFRNKRTVPAQAPSTGAAGESRQSSPPAASEPARPPAEPRQQPRQGTEPSSKELGVFRLRDQAAEALGVAGAKHYMTTREGMDLVYSRQTRPPENGLDQVIELRDGDYVKVPSGEGDLDLVFKKGGRYCVVAARGPDGLPKICDVPGEFVDAEAKEPKLAAEGSRRYLDLMLEVMQKSDKEESIRIAKELQAALKEHNVDYWAVGVGREKDRADYYFSVQRFEIYDSA
jgi:hypothetical protein